jgi:hypothetical protein
MVRRLQVRNFRLMSFIAQPNALYSQLQLSCQNVEHKFNARRDRPEPG